MNSHTWKSITFSSTADVFRHLQAFKLRIVWSSFNSHTNNGQMVIWAGFMSVLVWHTALLSEPDREYTHVLDLSPTNVPSLTLGTCSFMRRYTTGKHLHLFEGHCIWIGIWDEQFFQNNTGLKVLIICQVCSFDCSVNIVLDSIEYIHRCLISCCSYGPLYM